ncbi:MAG: hypothetical protein HY961_00215 [Ignavibacteriae bacterium]|nr:hypothetical protein [Ignavibacteriota bacterium]
MNELSDKLQELGLSGREAEIYIALLKKKEMTAPDIARITSVTRTKSYEILQNLVKKRVCNEKYQNGSKVFSSVEPTIAIQNLLAVYEEELTKKKVLAEQVREALAELHRTKEHKNEPLDYIEVLSDVKQIGERWMNILKNTRRELLAFTKPPYATSWEDNLEALAALLKGNTIVSKCIYEYKGLSPEQLKVFTASLEAFQGAGEEVRATEELPLKVVISDETTTMLALSDRISLRPSITTMIIDHPSFAKAQKKMFESYWANALTLEEFKNMVANLQ